MITPEMISRINELAKKKREGTLTDLECAEQAKLRRLYIDNIKSQVKSYLDAARSHAHSHDCNCGCHREH